MAAHCTLRYLRTALGMLLAAAAAGLPVQDAAAQKWPERTARIVTPFGPGGGTDIFARILAQRFSERLGQQFVVENRPGAGSTIGTESLSWPAARFFSGLKSGILRTTNRPATWSVFFCAANATNGTSATSAREIHLPVASS